MLHSHAERIPPTTVHTVELRLAGHRVTLLVDARRAGELLADPRVTLLETRTLDESAPLGTCVLTPAGRWHMQDAWVFRPLEEAR